MKIISCFLVLTIMTAMIIPASAENNIIGDRNNILLAQYVTWGV